MIYQVGRMGGSNNLRRLDAQLLLPLSEKFHQGFQ